MCSESDQDKEDRALDALMVMLMRQNEEREPTEDEIEEFMSADVNLTPEDQEALDRVSLNWPNVLKGCIAHGQGCMKVENERPE